MNYPDFIEELILSKSYTQLSEAEKALLAEWVTDEQEYEAIRLLLKGIGAAAQDSEQPPLAIKTSLQNAFAQKHPAKKRAALSWRAIAVTSIAASVVLVAYIGFLLTQDVAPPVAVNRPQAATEEAPMEQLPAQTESKTQENKNTQNNTTLQPPQPAVISDDEVAEQENINEKDVVTENAAPPAEDMDMLDLNNGVVPLQYNSPPESMPTSPQKQLSIEPLSIEEYKIIVPKVSSSVKQNNDLLDLGTTVY